MSILKVYKYPHPILREPTQNVDAVNDDIKQIIADMKDTLYSFPGCVGLAAPQVGHSLRIFLVDTTAGKKPDQLKVVINPEITHTAKNKMVREGCLSFPDYLVNVKRALKVTFNCLDEDGNQQEYQVRDLEAICIQHELDHLDGVLMIDRVQSIKTDIIPRTNPK